MLAIIVLLNVISESIQLVSSSNKWMTFQRALNESYELCKLDSESMQWKYNQLKLSAVAVGLDCSSVILRDYFEQLVDMSSGMLSVGTSVAVKALSQIPTSSQVASPLLSSPLRMASSLFARVSTTQAETAHCDIQKCNTHSLCTIKPLRVTPCDPVRMVVITC